jgi:riboflavin synthase alpha subunit
MGADLVTNINWPGSSSFTTGSTPFGLYDSESIFREHADKVNDWVAKRLGYPVQNVELLPENIYAVFEESISEYSAQVNAFNIRNNLYNMMGHDNTDNLTDTYIEGANTTQIINISQAYGAEAGVGGHATIYKGHVDLATGIQRYDLKNISPTTGSYLSGSGQYIADIPTGSLESGSHYGKSLTITRIFYEGIPAISRFFDPYAVSAVGTMNLMDEFGFSSFSPAAQFVLMPVYEDMLRIQAIEFNDQVRRSAYSFNLVNNVLEIFPIPGSSTYTPKRLYFEYVLTDERTEASVIHKPNVISSYANIKYDSMTYTSINSVGKQWIWKYTLALAKELLGGIREKYASIPIPEGEVSLDGASLRAEAQNDKDRLYEQLRQDLEELSRPKQMEYKAQEAEQIQKMLKNIPLPFYIG